jgi:hypothetical protein
MNDRISSRKFRLYDVISPYIGIEIAFPSFGLSLNRVE